MGNIISWKGVHAWRFGIAMLLMGFAINSAWAQISLDGTKSSLGRVIEQIKSQSSYQFFYQDRLASTPVTPTKLRNASLQEVLQQVLKGTNISFTVDENIVFLSEVKSVLSIEQVEDGVQTISGRVIDEEGDPLIGANVLIKGSTLGVTTNLDGAFSIQTSEAAPNLVITSIGFKTQIVTEKVQTNMLITMQTEMQQIDEVVVTALGIKRAVKALSYNAQEIGNEEFIRVKDGNLINSLSGRAAGVTVNGGSSGVGGASKVIMRGTKGIDQSSNALYVIDGVPMFNLTGTGDDGFGSRGVTEAIADINPEDIESMTVLTGAAAAALYGSYAANGAVVITTKKGQEGRLSVTFSQNTQFLSPFVMPKFQNSYGTGDLLSTTGSVERSWGEKLDATHYQGYDPVRDFLQTGVVTTETLSLSTGTDKNQTYFSVGAVNSKGMVPNNRYDRYNFTFRNTTLFLANKMVLDLGASYIKQKDRNMVNQGTYSNPLVTAYLFPRGDDWNDIKTYERWDSDRNIYTQYWPQGIYTFTGQNPYWVAYRNLRENNRDRYMLNASLSYKVLDWLSVSGRVRMDNAATTFTDKMYASSNTTLTEGSSNGLYGIQKTDDRQFYADLMVNIQKNFGEKLSLVANLGTSLSDMQQDLFENRGPISENGIPNLFNVFQLDDVKTVRKQAGFREQTQSLFASVELGYRSAYYLTLTGRTDWPSQLAGPNSVSSAFFYPSVGGTVILSELFQMPRQISFLKLRGSFASVGLPFPRFLANPTYTWDNDNKVWQPNRNYPMYNLKPERTNSWEVGVTAHLFDGLRFDIALYDTKTYNQTFDPKISVSSGYSTLYVQTGSVRNRGIELGLGCSHSFGKLRWSSNYLFSTNENEILELLENYVHPETGAIITKDRLDVGGMGQARFVLKKGGSLGDLYSTADLHRDSEGNILVDENGHVTANYNAGDIKLGSVFPKSNMSWSNQFTWNNFGLGFMISARLGGIVYSATQAAMDLYGVSQSTEAARDQGGVWVNGTDLVNAQQWYTTISSQSGIPQYYTYSATNVRLQDAHISYTFPRQAVWNIADVTLGLVGRNLWMLYCKAPFDPETVATTGNYYQGIDNFMMPSAQSLEFNVRLKF